jgi:hypothetical protein
LPPRNRLDRVRLGVEVLGLYAEARWLVLRDGPVPAVTALRRGLTAHTSDAPAEERVRRSARLGRAVMKSLRPLPLDSRCLMRSLVLTGLLAKRGIYGKVIIGVQTTPKFAAHAWVEVDGQAVLPTNDPDYHRLTEM